MLSKWKFLVVAMAVLALGLGSAQAQTADDGTAAPAEEPAEPAPSAEPVELKVGPAQTAGLVSFFLG